MLTTFLVHLGELIPLPPKKQSHHYVFSLAKRVCNLLC